MERVYRAFSSAGTFPSNVLHCKIQSGPYKLRPHVVRDYTWGRTEEGFDRTWRSEAAIRIEAWRDDTPLLQISKESANSRVVLDLRCGLQRATVVSLPSKGTFTGRPPVSTPQVCDHRQTLDC